MKNGLSIPLLCLASCAFAQKSFFGVDGGINVANQRMIVDPGLQGPTFFQNIARPTFGIFYQHDFTGVLGLRINAQYMGLGYKDRNNSQYDVSINYLTFPLAFYYRANKHLSLNAGPYLSFTVGGTNINNEDITKTYHKNDFGFSLGAEHDIYKRFAIGVSYFVGTKNIWLNDSQGTIKFTNRALQFVLIYKFKKTLASIQ